MSLGLLEAKLPCDAAAAQPIAREARQAVAAALVELHELSQRSYRPCSPNGGLGAALKELADRAPLTTYLACSPRRPLPPEAEAAGYFVVSQALTNAAKHAEATEVRVGAVVRHTPARCRGGRQRDRWSESRAGSGLRGLADRREALGGRLVVFSPRGRGTIIRAALPCG